ncbi:MAG: pyruvate kinase [Candidatus Sumerlaeales bacterium]|nr:pyruvate kinase [Candidatus Sumerlaeales bacterium]
MLQYNFSTHKRTKIVATIGPASDSIDVLRQLVKAGVNVFRLNFSHGTHESHLNVIKNIRQVSAEFEQPVGILGDLCGPKLRLGILPPEGVYVKAGTIIELVNDPQADGTNNRFSVSIPCFEEAAQIGNRVLIDDGNIVLTVVKISDGIVFCKMEFDGVLKSRKGVNVPETPLPVPALTDKDKADMRFAIENGVDLLALSFVRRVDDLIDAYSEMRLIGKRVPLFAKIEMAEATQNLEEIVTTCDGIMVARGDLGCEIPLEEVPLIQKSLIALCNKQIKPVITATQLFY